MFGAIIPAVLGGAAAIASGINKSGSTQPTWKPRGSAFSYGGLSVDANGEVHRTGSGDVAPALGLQQLANQYSGENQLIGAGRGQSAEARRLLLESLAAGPSAAEQAARAQAEQIGQQARTLAANGPYNPAAIRNAQNWAAGAHQRLLPQQMAGQLQEAEQIRQARMQALLGMRQQDIGQIGQEMGLEGARHQYALGLEGQASGRMGMNAQNQQYAQNLAADYQRLMAQQQNLQNQQQNAANQQQSQNMINLGMGLFQGAAGMGQSAMMGQGKSGGGGGTNGGSDLIDPWSDVRAKTDRRQAGPEVNEFLQELAARGQQGYRYRPGFGGGPGYGPMAQDLEQTEVGKALVGRDRQGMRYIKGDRALTALMAGQGALQDQINQLVTAPRLPAGMTGPARYTSQGGWESLPEGQSWADVDRQRLPVDELLAHRGQMARSEVDVPALLAQRGELARAQVAPPPRPPALAGQGARWTPEGGWEAWPPVYLSAR